jgi:aromatic-L-amino-acid/L-tryptophan decarboxylase
MTAREGSVSAPGGRDGHAADERPGGAADEHHGHAADGRRHGSENELPGVAGLEMEPELMRRLGYRVIDLLVSRHAGLGAAPVWRGASRAELEAKLRGPAPDGPGACDDILDRIVADVLPFGASVDHPRFMAFVPGAPTWPGVLGDLIAAGTNIFQGTWLASAGVSTLELIVIDWFRDWLGCDARTAGLLVSGGSAANLTAIACARTSRYDAHHAAAVIYCSAETHSSVLRAARVLGFAADRVHSIAVDDDDRIDCAALEQRITADRDAGLQPFLVVANAGTTSTGGIDPLPQLADICHRNDVWLHVDAAYGGFAVLTTRGRTALAGIGRADSIALDPHKWLYQPFEVGCLLVRDGALLERAFHVMPPYLQDTALPDTQPDSGASQDALPVNFANRGIQLTRAGRALKVWLSVQTFGVAAFRDAIDRCLDLAGFAEARIRLSDDLELLTPARLGIVCFRRRCDDGTDHDAYNERLLHSLLRSGTAMISSTRVRGVFALRLCVLNFRTSEADIERTLAWIETHEGDAVQERREGYAAHEGHEAAGWPKS